jgi:hypothetical protein
MKSSGKTRLGKLLEFSELTVDGVRKLSARKQKALCERIYFFPIFHGQVEGPGGGADAITPEKIGEIAFALGVMLRSWQQRRPYSLKSRGEEDEKGEKPGPLRPDEIKLTWRLTGKLVKPGGDLASMLKFEAMQLLKSDGHWLRRCAGTRPPCRRLFVTRKAGAVYCSPRCAKRIEMRRYRARLRERATSGAPKRQRAAVKKLVRKL